MSGAVPGVAMLCVWWVALCVGGKGAYEPAPAPAAPRPTCPRDHAQYCHALYHRGESSHFDINGTAVTYKYTDGGFFALKCPPGIVLDEPALPRFEPALRVLEVQLACRPPVRTATYAAALSALHVNALDAADLGEGVSTLPTYLIMLQLNRKFDPSILAAMSNLRALNISETKLTLADLMQLPDSLQRLQLRNTMIGHVSAAALIRLPNLTEVEITDTESVLVEAVGNLRSLTISSHATLVSLSLPDTLKSLQLSNWAPRDPEPWHSCAGLENLRVFGTVAKMLPDGWLFRCVHLRELLLSDAANLRTLPAGALRGAVALEEVDLSSSALEALPAGLFDDARALRVLTLWDNRLLTLPGDLFKHQGSLRELNLAENNLISSALGSLEDATSLISLDLSNNAALDPCPAAGDATHNDTSGRTGSSPLRHMKNLSYLRVDDTATPRVCPDWHELPQLSSVTLSGTAVASRITFADLRFNSIVDIEVYLGGDTMHILLRREDYESVIAAPAEPQVLLSLSGEPSLRCDCELYWAAATLRHPHSRLRENGALCRDGRWLESVPLEELVCAAPGPCPAAVGCVCATREHMAGPGPLLRLDCAGAGLSSVPRVDARAALQYTGAEPVVLDLRLANNRISRLGTEDLLLDIEALDLRNNSLSVIDAATVAALVERAGRRVLLAGNPLECDCRAAPALTAMHAHPNVFRDWANATCSDGTSLALLQPCHDGNVPGIESGGLSGGAVAALVLGTAAAAALVLLLAVSTLRRRLCATLWSQRPQVLRLARRRPDADEWVYDAFVSFAHADEEVVRELVEELEGGAAPLRLCVHYRDWVPGDWIPAQIAASVRVSRRTVAVVSEAFLRSKWARAEFREAYAAALEDGEPRLVLVLLEDPARLPLDAELRAYASGNTYVRWGDPWFWRKLRRALPAPALPAAPAPAPETAPVADVTPPAPSCA